MGNSSDDLEGASPSMSLNVGEYVLFGNYPQSDADTPEPIEWLVLDNDGETALLLSKYGLEEKPFHNKSENTNWRDCYLRKWMNSIFINYAFDEHEQELIAESVIFTNDNPEYGTKGCGETRDKVFCFSIDEANTFFQADNIRECKYNPFAVRNNNISDEGVGSFWLRSPGKSASHATYCSWFGRIGESFPICFGSLLVRPALRIYLNNNLSLSAKNAEQMFPSSGNVSNVVLSGKSNHPDLRISVANVSASAPFKSSNSESYEYVKFGRYPQNDSDKPEPIEWLVLKNDGKTALLLSKFGLDCKKFHNEDLDTINWRNCDLRKWLNNDFLCSSFNSHERNQIVLSDIYTEHNYKIGTKSCGGTRDKVFCLSIEEVEMYFNSKKNRKCKSTAYALSSNAKTYKNGYCRFWLRSPGFYLHRSNIYNNKPHIYIPCVLEEGSVSYGGQLLIRDDVAVRPALRVKVNESFPLSYSNDECLSTSSEKAVSISTSCYSSYNLKHISVMPFSSNEPIQSFEPGEYVKFGSYPQNNGYKPEPIEWLVLENDGKTALILSKYGLDSKDFHHINMEVGWRYCDLRQWLNSEFLHIAFKGNALKRIADSVIYTGNNPIDGNKGCGITRDKVFCLSIEEAYKYFGHGAINKKSQERWGDDTLNKSTLVCREEDLQACHELACQATAFAIAEGVYVGRRFSKLSRSFKKPDEWCFDNCLFWLRSPGTFFYDPYDDTFGLATCVWYDGIVDSEGIRPHLSSDSRINSFCAVRPALRIKL